MTTKMCKVSESKLVMLGSPGVGKSGKRKLFIRHVHVIKLRVLLRKKLSKIERKQSRIFKQEEMRVTCSSVVVVKLKMLRIRLHIFCNAIHVYSSFFRNCKMLALLARKAYIGDQWRIQGDGAQLSAKFLQNNRLAHRLREFASPAPRKSWIHPWGSKNFSVKKRRNTTTEGTSCVLL